MKRHLLLFPVNLQYFNQEKTEKATPRKKQEAREKGQVAKSADLSPALGLVVIFFTLFIAGSWMYESFQQMLRESLTVYAHWDLTTTNLAVISQQLAFVGMKIVGPVFLVALVMAILFNYLQVGPLFTVEPLKLKLEKIDPIKGAKRILSLRSIVELLKAILKISAGLYVAYLILWRSKDQLLFLSQLPIQEVASFAAGEVLKLGFSVGLLLIVLAVLDYGYQRYEHEKSLRMSKQDIKDEYKKTEGDPLIKSKIKERQRQMAMRRMMQELPKADVIITNPTHYAVAIRYDAEEMEAPTVIAKGKDFLALKIKELAKKHHIVTMENRPLARALYSQVEIGQQIPEDLFKAVAEVLAYVYKLQGKVK